MSFALVDKGSSFLTIRLRGEAGRRYSVRVGDATRSDVEHDATLTFRGLEPNARHVVRVFVFPRRYKRVMIRNNSSKDPLSLAEVQVFDFDGRQVSRDWSNVRRVRQTSTAHGGSAYRAIDGNHSGQWNENSVTHTKDGSVQYWTLEFKVPVSIRSVMVFNRTDCCSDRLHGATLMLRDDGNRTVHRKTLSSSRFQSFRFAA